MKTWDEMTRSGGIDSYQNYIGSTEHKHSFVFLSRTRDSNVLEVSNFESSLKELGGESETVQVHRFSHWGPGWFELILIDPCDFEAVEKAERMLDALSDYPILDESDYCQRESDAWEESYNFSCQSDLIAEIDKRVQESETRFFLNDSDEIELTDEQEILLFEIATDNASQSSYESWDIKDIVDEFLAQAVHDELEYHPDLFEPSDTLVITPEIADQITSLLNA